MEEGCVKIMLTVSCLEWLTCLLLFTMVEFEKLQPRFQNGTHFSCHESLSKGYNVHMSMFNSHMRCYVRQWSCSDNVVASTVCTDTLYQETKICISKIRSYVKMTLNQKEQLKHLTSLAYKFQFQLE